MSTTKEINLGKLTVGRRIEFTLLQDGVAWDGVDSVTLVLEKPDRVTQLTRTMTLDTGNVWYYILTSSDIATDGTDDGYWTVSVEAVDGTIDLEYPYEVSFNVKEQP